MSVPNTHTGMQELLLTALHDVKNPLAVIRASAQLGLQVSETVERERLLQSIIEQVDRIRELVNTLVGNLAPNGNRVARSVCPVCVAERVLRSFEPVFSEKHIKVTRCWSSSPRVMLIDDYFMRAFENILANAVNAVGEGGTITLNSHQEDGSFVLAVSDDGPGIPDHLADRIMQPFVSGTEGGTGLGLYIAKRLICQVHAGGLWFETSARGTTFYVSLPVLDSGCS